MEPGQIERKAIAVSLIDENPNNPNKMTGREFDLLVHNIQARGLVENIVVRPVDGGRFRVYSGHHRLKAAIYLGYEEVPCAIVNDPNFTEDMEEFQLIRMNAIKGHLDPQLFVKMYAKYAPQYGDDLLQDMFGFAEEADFKRLVAKTAQSLPKDMQAAFKDGAKEIKTIEGLSALLNKLFSQYGDTVPYGYMVFDQGGQRHVWLRVCPKTFEAVTLIGQFCHEQEVTVDDVIGAVVRAIAEGNATDLITAALEKAPKVVLPTGLGLMPTKDNLAAMAGVGA